jgi:hypothetical protein
MSDVEYDDVSSSCRLECEWMFTVGGEVRMDWKWEGSRAAVKAVGHVLNHLSLRLVNLSIIHAYMKC